jgi:methionyl aminopeptidase
MITIKTQDEIEQMATAGEITAGAIEAARRIIAPGVSTLEIDTVVREYMQARGAVPSFLNLYGFPGSACISLNEEVIHGIPSASRKLKEGDIVKIDTGAFYGGFHGDCTRTFAVGKISEEAERLIQVTRQSFYEGLAYCRPGSRLGDIGAAIERYAVQNGFSPVRDFVGHGIGQNVHESPDVPNYGPAGRGIRLEEGMTLAIEPMINAGTFEVVIKKDKWTVLTRDDRLSAHYENTIAITKDAPRILTRCEE